MGFEGCPPAVPTVQADNEDVKITRWDFAPGASTGWHVHELPYVIVLITPAMMRLHDGSQIRDVTFNAGDAYSRPSGVAHDVMNASNSTMAFVEIEMKRAATRAQV